MTYTVRARIARVAVWLLALASIVTGASLVGQRSVLVWRDVAGSGDTASADIVDVTGLGTALLCVGVLVLAAALLVEGYRRPEIAPHSTTDAALSPESPRRPD